MLSPEQIEFRADFLSPFKQKLYYLKKLPMGLISGTKLTYLDENKAIAEVPFRWCNKNPFNSMYFAVQSMAAELSTAAPVLLAIKAVDASVAFIIVGVKVDFVQKAQSTVTFTCIDYDKINTAATQLKHSGDTATVTVKTIGRDVEGNEVSTFYFTWSFKRRK